METEETDSKETLEIHYRIFKLNLETRKHGLLK